MTDFDFLNWVADRFVHRYGESENVDFVLRLRTLATASQKLVARSGGPEVPPAGPASKQKGGNAGNELPGQTSVYDFQDDYDPRDDNSPGVW